MDISIIMPVYNGERFLREAVEGVLNQQFSGTFELLIADDQSTDGTAAILAEYVAAQPDVVKVFYNSKNLGCSSNSISLAKRARGKYLAFCDADDIWIDPLKLQKQYDFLEQHANYDMVCTDAKIVDEKDQILQEGITGGDANIDFSTLIRKHGDVYNSSIMMRTDFYRKMLADCAWFEKHNCFFDTIWSWYASKMSHLRYMAEPMIAFRMLTDSDSRSSNEQKSKQLEKRYYQMKAAFLLIQCTDIDEALDVLLGEYDYYEEQNFQSGMYQGEEKVRKSKAYHIGKVMTKPFAAVRAIIKSCKA